MEKLSSVTVELFDYWLRNSFFWEYGDRWEYGDGTGRATQDFYPTDSSEDAQEIKIEIAAFGDGELRAEVQVLVTRRKYYARYLVRESQEGTFKTIGEILIEQLEVDQLRVHFYEAEGSGFAAKFSGWLDRVYKGSEPAAQQKKKRDTTDTRAGTLNRVREMHELLKGGISARQAARRAGTDSRTYLDLCKEATGEDPIYTKK